MQAVSDAEKKKSAEAAKQKGNAAFTKNDFDGAIKVRMHLVARIFFDAFAACVFG